ncbi:MAG: beta-galactosidase, partial [Armatimonadota bacterium]
MMRTYSLSPVAPACRRRSRFFLAAGFSVFLISLLPGAPVGAQGSANLVGNGGFEQDTAGWAWMTASGAPATGVLDSGERHTGRHSYRVSGDFTQTPHTYGRLHRTITGLRPFTTYRIRAWIKGSKVGTAWIGGGPGWYLRAVFPEGDFDWREITTEYATGGEAGDFELMVLLESRTGAVWVDDIEMTEVRADAARRDQAENAIRTSLEAEQAHLARLRAKVETNHALRDDRYITLGLAVAERFLTPLSLPLASARQSPEWQRLQTEEVRQVLDQTDTRIAQWTKETSVSGRVPAPTSGATSIRDGVFETKIGSKTVPYYFGGYGHFGSAARDIPVFPALGASLIQQERGPSSSLDPDHDTLLEGGRSLVDTLRLASRSRMKIDLLLSPHYFPDWAVKKAPDVLNGNPGFIGFNIDHPVARSVVERHLRTLLPAVRTEPALLSLCLSNEPIYSSSGRDPHSRPLWTAYLRDVHGTVDAVNVLYGTRYARLEEVPVPPVGMPAESGAQRAYFDWCRFNQRHFADWHLWMSDLCHKEAPGVPTHAKIMVFDTFERGLVHRGVDPELFCEATDIAGCDAYAFFRGDLLARFQRAEPLTPAATGILPEDYAYSWLGHELFYDLLHSFKGQPVFNSENHIIPDNSPAQHIPSAHTRAVFWQGALHHQGATTTWVWEDGTDAFLAGSIYFRPANTYAEGRALLDLNRLSAEVTAINRQKPRVAILYSPTSIFWEPDYGAQVSRVYAALRFQGQPCTFVSERQLQSGKFAKVDRIIVPHATHVADTAVAALRRYVKTDRNRVLFVGDNNLAFDEYHRPRSLPAQLTASVILDETKGGKPGNTAFVRSL